MDRPHQLAAACGHAILYQQAIEVDAFVAQRIAFVHADDCRRQSFHVVRRGETRPCQRIALVERLDAIAHGAAIAVQDRKSTRLNSSHPSISYAVFCLKKKKKTKTINSKY